MNATLQQLPELFEQSATFEGFVDLLEQLRAQQVPIASQIGQPLSVCSYRVQRMQNSIVWRYQIHSEQAFEVCTEAPVHLQIEKDLPMKLNVLSVGLQISLHHPADVSEQQYLRYGSLLREVSGESAAFFACSICPQEFISYQQTLLHEQGVHNLRMIDSRPRLS